MPSVSIANAPDTERAVIAAAVSASGVRLIRDIRLGDPPPGVKPLDGYPGDRWLYLEVPVGGETDIRVEQDWEAANLSGRIRIAALAAGLPAPFGYSTTGVQPDGTRVPPFEIVIGALPTDVVHPAIDMEAEASRINEAARSVSLSLRELEFKGSDAAAFIRLSTNEAPSKLVERWSAVLESIAGEPEIPWLVVVEDEAGDPIRAFGNSPLTAGTTGWTRPDLRGIEVELGHE